MDDIYELSRALTRIRDLVSKQKIRKSKKENNFSLNEFKDLSIRLLEEEFEEIPFQRKCARVKSQNQNWISIQSNSKTFLSKPEKTQKKRFLAVLETKEKPKVFRSLKCEQKEEKSEKKKKFYEKSEIREFIEKQKKKREEKSREKEEKKKSFISVIDLSFKPKVRQKVFKKEIKINKENEEKEEKSEEQKSEEKEEPKEAPNEWSEEPSAASVVGRALLEVPDWDTLCERVFNDSSLRQRLSSDVRLSTHDLFRLTSDLNDVNDDDTDDVSSLQSEVVSESLDFRSEIDANCRRIHALGPNEDQIKDLFFCGDTGSAFRVFLFDFCKELVLKEFRMKPEVKEMTLTVPLRLQKRFWPKTSREMTSFVVKRAEEMTGRTEKETKDIRRQKLMAFCRQNRKKDFIDGVLQREMATDDPLWTHFEAESRDVKNKISDLIFNELLSEALKEGTNSFT